MKKELGQMKRLPMLMLITALCLMAMGGCAGKGAAAPDGRSPQEGDYEEDGWEDDEDEAPAGAASEEAGEAGVETVTAAADEPVAAVLDESGRYGYLNTKGEWVIAPQYYGAYPFCNGYATVCTDMDARQWRIIDKQNNVVKEFDGVYVREVPADYYYYEPLTRTIVDDMIIISKDDPYDFNARLGFANNKGEIVLEPVYCEVKAFREGLAAVNFGTVGEPNWGYVDKTGKTVIPAQFQAAWLFADGLAYAERAYDPAAPGMEAGFIDTTGDLALHQEYEYDSYNMPWPAPGYGGRASDFFDGLAVANVNVQIDNALIGVLGVVDKRGNVLWCDADNQLSPDGGNGSVIGDGLYCVRGEPDQNGDCPEGFIDLTGAVVIAPTMQWRSTGFFHEGLCRVRTRDADARDGFIDTTGRVAVELKYRGADDFSCGYAAVSENGYDWFYIDKTGAVAIAGGFAKAGPFTK